MLGGLLILQGLTMSFYENSNMFIVHMGSKWPSFAQRPWRGKKFRTKILYCNASAIFSSYMLLFFEFFWITKNEKVQRPLFYYFLLPMASVVLATIYNIVLYCIVLNQQIRSTRALLTHITSSTPWYYQSYGQKLLFRAKNVKFLLQLSKNNFVND